jgi:hypothetical protein
MKQIDNVNVKLGDDLKDEIKKGSSLSIAAASFSIYAFEALKKELKGIDNLRFVFTSPTFVSEKFEKQTRQFYIPHIFNETHLCGGEFELRLKNELTQKAIAKECANWVKEKATFKSNKNSNQPLHGMLHVATQDQQTAYTNISSFTTSDLGFTPKKGFPTLIQKIDYPESKAYLDWFSQVWKNEESLQDVTEYVQEYFENAFKDNSPEFIYFVYIPEVIDPLFRQIVTPHSGGH